MPSNLQTQITRTSPKGDVLIRSFCTPEEIRGYVFDRYFGAYAQYRSIYTKRESLEKNASRDDANVVLALAHDTHIVGFGVLNFPGPDQRWAELGPEVMIEVRAVEVSRQWRGGGMAHDIMRMLMTHPRIEEMIAYLVGYSWTWDLDGTGKSAQAYRNMLITLYAPYGFQELPTNEPNVSLKPENLFMGRIGANVPAQIQKDFKWLRFGISP